MKKDLAKETRNQLGFQITEDVTESYFGKAILPENWKNYMEK
ncbi:hypothetical protein [Zunongwangia profunda]|nr:hypothetical protein [Zunongwangia profunda]